MNPLPGHLVEPLERLLRDSPHLWRGEAIARVDVRATGYAALDARLPGGGWPIGALVEIASACDGLGELSLTLPALRSWCQDGRSVAFVHPPYTPYAPALARYGLLARIGEENLFGNIDDALNAARQMVGVTPQPKPAQAVPEVARERR